MAATFSSTATQALLLAPAKMTSCARLASSPSNALVPFAKRSRILTAPVTEPNFRAVQPMATSAAKETRNENPPAKTGKEGQALTLPRQQSLSLLDSWDPFSLTTRSLRKMMETIDRLFPGSPSTGLMGAGDAGIRLPWDVVEEDDKFHMRIDIPGFSKEEVKVRVEDRVLVVEAERKTEERDDDKKWEGRSYGKFCTRIVLPENVEADKVAAKLRNGVLELTVPKVKDQAKQVIDVKLEE